MRRTPSLKSQAQPAECSPSQDWKWHLFHVASGRIVTLAANPTNKMTVKLDTTLVAASEPGHLGSFPAPKWRGLDLPRALESRCPARMTRCAPEGTVWSSDSNTKTEPSGGKGTRPSWTSSPPGGMVILPSLSGGSVQAPPGTRMPAHPPSPRPRDFPKRWDQTREG